MGDYKCLDCNIIFEVDDNIIIKRLDKMSINCPKCKKGEWVWNMNLIRKLESIGGKKNV